MTYILLTINILFNGILDSKKFDWMMGFFRNMEIPVTFFVNVHNVMKDSSLEPVLGRMVYEGNDLQLLFKPDLTDEYVNLNDYASDLKLQYHYLKSQYKKTIAYRGISEPFHVNYPMLIAIGRKGKNEEIKLGLNIDSSVMSPVPKSSKFHFCGSRIYQLPITDLGNGRQWDISNEPEDIELILGIIKEYGGGFDDIFLTMTGDYDSRINVLNVENMVSRIKLMQDVRFITMAQAWGILEGKDGK